MMTMMTKIVKSAYVKFGVRKTNNAMSVTSTVLRTLPTNCVFERLKEEDIYE